MPDGIVDIAMLLACSLAAVGGARLLGSRMWLGSVVTTYRHDDWPYGTQEPDASVFAVAHADALRPSRPAEAVTTADFDGQPAAPEIVELHVRGYTRQSNAELHR
jgi:hypothetical protein